MVVVFVDSFSSICKYFYYKCLLDIFSYKCLLLYQTTIKCASPYEKLRKKEKNLESQKGLLNKFIINDKQNIIKNLNIREKKSLIFVVALAQNV